MSITGIRQSKGIEKVFEDGCMVIISPADGGELRRCVIPTQKPKFVKLNEDVMPIRLDLLPLKLKEGEDYSEEDIDGIANWTHEQYHKDCRNPEEAKK